MTAPSSGATQNSHSWPAAAPSPKYTVAVERAGFRPAFETGSRKAVSTDSTSPTANGALPGRAPRAVAPRYTATSRAAPLASARNTPDRPKPLLPLASKVFEMAEKRLFDWEPAGWLV